MPRTEKKYYAIKSKFAFTNIIKKASFRMRDKLRNFHQILNIYEKTIIHFAQIFIVTTVDEKTSFPLTHFIS